MRNCLIVLLFVVTGICSAAELQLASVFSDHMVLQRNQPVPVWGTTDAGATVTVEFAGQKKTATADSGGKWRTDLDPLKASARGDTMTVSASGIVMELSDVLIGEVWLCSGQSNMQWSMGNTENASNALATASHPDIRLYRTPLVFSNAPIETINAVWTECTPETVKQFSGVAYYFGRKLQEELDVPVGLLQSAWGGTRIEPWTPPCGFEGFESLADIRRKINPMPALDGNPKSDRQFPTAIYNGMIHAHIPFAIKGAIWYQGESNRSDGMLYVDKTAAQLKGWRSLWGQDIPYYFVQIAPYQYGQEDPAVLAEFWEAQAEIVKIIPQTGMAVVSDAATLSNIHPPNKEVPGTRLALLALDNTYGKDIVSTGPVFQSLEIKKGHLEVLFSEADGLTTRDGKAPDYFEIVGEDGHFKPVQARIKGNRVILRSPEVSRPVAMRFAWHKLATPNLMNAAGLPAVAFRAGDAPEPKLPDLTQLPEMKEFKIIYQLVIPVNCGYANTAPDYAIDNSAEAGSFSQVAYLLERLDINGHTGRYEVDGELLVWYRDISENPQEVGTVSRLGFAEKDRLLIIFFTLPNGDRYEWVWRRL